MQNNPQIKVLEIKNLTQLSIIGAAMRLFIECLDVAFWKQFIKTRWEKSFNMRTYLLNVNLNYLFTTVWNPRNLRKNHNENT